MSICQNIPRESIFTIIFVLRIDPARVSVLLKIIFLNLTVGYVHHGEHISDNSTLSVVSPVPPNSIVFNSRTTI